MLRECVIVDGVRTPNGRAHAQKGWFRNKRPDELLTAVYDALFARNKQIDPEQVEAVYVGTANQTGVTNDIARLAWLAGGFPESVATNAIGQQCPSGMAAVEHAARAIMCGEGDIYIAAGVEDMLKVPMGEGMDFPPRLAMRYPPEELPMGPTAEKVAELWKVSREDMERMAYYSHKRAAEARDAGKFKNEIVPIEGEKEDGTPFIVDRDQWIRDDVSLESMATMVSPFKPGGVITAATSSPLTTGACALLLMERKLADRLGCEYHLVYRGGAMAGCDPTIMGVGPIYAVRKLLQRTGVSIDEIDVVEINEAFASQSLVCLRELGIEENAPFKKTNLWGGALALGHPLGESGARIIITLNNIMKTDCPEARYGLATLCGGFGNANATLWEKAS
ncbi:MAG TPA: thiolase family protein [Bacillota bacterium]|nr:thiolase family protein [Bacillota bacterium]HOP69189.1 thiolase family protein [Bacillota bacterium]HPT34611.1 thiolase family protein [Bacillota bacterium]HQD06592.1 thiolase family protein [Bacillota bacterium]